MAKPGKAQTWIEYGVARSMLGVLGVFPLRWSMAMGRALGRVAYAVAGELRRTGQINLRLAFPDKSEQERQEILLACFQNLGRHFALFAHFVSDSREQLLQVIEWKGREHFVKAREQERPVIIVSGHLGAWELASFGLSLVDSPFSFLVRRIDNPKVEERVDQVRSRFGNQSIDKRGAARPMLSLLKSGGTLGLLVDLNTLDEEAIFVDFFGVPASTTFMLAKLALRTDASVVPAFALWDETLGKFVFEFLPAVTIQQTGDERKDVRALTAALSQKVEDYIRKYPEQWLWIHKRWKTRPQGEPQIY